MSRYRREQAEPGDPIRVRLAMIAVSVVAFMVLGAIVGLVLGSASAGAIYAFLLSFFLIAPAVLLGKQRPSSMVFKALRLHRPGQGGL